MEQTTTINRNWLLKMIVFIVALAGLGVWGVVDAFMVLPSRGLEHAQWTEAAYLDKAESTGQLLQTPVPKPVEELARLASEQNRLEKDQALPREKRELELLRLEWLTSLSRIGRLDAAHTDIKDPRARLTELQAKVSGQNPPKPLAAYDIPLQWVFILGGFGIAAYLMYLVAAVSRKKFTWDPATHRLTLPDGRSVVPDDILEVDKRKWDKFYVFLKPKDGSKEIKLDLLRFKNLEEWVLEFEKHTEAYEPPPEEPKAEDADGPSADASSAASA